LSTAACETIEVGLPGYTPMRSVPVGASALRTASGAFGGMNVAQATSVAQSKNVTLRNKNNFIVFTRSIRHDPRFANQFFVAHALAIEQIRKPLARAGQHLAATR
jgi:hypothetical protein